MSFFAEIENDEENPVSFFTRLKGLRPGFMQRVPAHADEVRAEKRQREPRFETASRPVNPQHMTLGMRLRGGDVTDVDAYDLNDTTNARHAQGPDVEASPSEAVPDASTHDSGVSDVQPELATQGTMDFEPEVVPAGIEPAVGPMSTRVATDSALTIVAEVRVPVVTHDEGNEPVEADMPGTPAGLPRLVSADSISFKRILCDGDSDAALRITADARRQFIAVELQVGIALVVATQRFHETSLYATYLKDLQRVDIVVREEMVATIEVIADVYAAHVRRSAAIVSETSRAIGVFRDVTEAAHAYGASDIHWEYRDFNDEVELRFRVHGDLYTYRHMPKALVRRALSAAYQDLVQRNTNSGETFQPSAPQSAMIPLVAKTDIVNLRWQGIPLVGGFDVALRLLDGNFRNCRLLLPHEMGLETSQVEIIDALGRVSGGVTLLTGETGSAKTTLLRAMSYLLASRDLRKQYAVNEPSEVPAPWLSDISIQRRPDETDEEAIRKCVEVIRSLMRGDPDDLTVGEIRDHVIAGLVAELALTGHPVRGTLHADSLIGGFMRLAGGRLQLPMDEVASEKFVNAMGNQKLIPKLCPHCKVPAADVMPAHQLEILRTKFGLDTSAMACRHEPGCEHCRLDGLFTRAGKVAAGTVGQTLAMEIYRPTAEFLDRIERRDWRGAETVWRSGRTSSFESADMTGKSIYEHALYKASTGLIDPRFIDESMRPFEAYRVLPGVDGSMPS